MAQHLQVVYNLTALSANQRGELVAMLSGRGISHDWRTATTLVVADLVESEVDVMIGAIGGPGDLVVDDEGTKRPPSAGIGSPAPWLLRGWAFGLDAVLMSIAWWVALGAPGVGASPATGSRAVGAAILALYFVGFVSLGGHTPGKMAVRIRIVDTDTGQPPGPLHAAIRLVVPNLLWMVGLVRGGSFALTDTDICVHQR